MQLPVSQAVPVSRRIEAAGAITIIFGVLTALLAAGWMITSAIARAGEEDLPFAEAAVALLVGTGFVLLGWGVLRCTRLCAGLAAGLAGTLLVLQVLSMLAGNGGGSLYLLLLPIIVVTANGLAWREIGPKPIGDQS